MKKNSIFYQSEKTRNEESRREIYELRKLSLSQSAKIVEELVTSDLGKEICRENRKMSKGNEREQH